MNNRISMLKSGLITTLFVLLILFALEGIDRNKNTINQFGILGFFHQIWYGNPGCI